MFLVVLLQPAHTLADALQVSIEGLSGPELTNVKNLLTIYQLLDEERLIDKVKSPEPTELDPAMSERRLKRIHDAADLEIRTALQPFGYYSPTIKSAIEKIDDVWTAMYSVEVGVPVKVDQVLISVQSDNDELKRQLENPKPDEQSLRIQVGQRLLHQKYSRTKSQLLEAAVDRGYLDAQFSVSEFRVNTDTFSASVHLALDTGQRYRFGEISLEQDILRQDAIAKYIPFETGEIFDTSQLINLQLALNDSGYFDRVEVTADRESASDQAIPIVVTAEASSPRQYSLGFGYGTDTGFRSKFGVQFRRINDRGHKAHTDLLLSEVKRSATAQYEIPLGELGANSLRYVARYEEEDIGDGETERYVLGVNYNDIWRGWQRRLYLNYQREKFRFGTDEQTVRFIIPGINLIYTKADNLLLPQRGYSWFLDLHGGNDAVVSDTTFVQGRLVGQRVWSPSDRMRILIRAEYGATKVDDFDLLPTSERFFAGGDRSVRGYEYQSLGPTDDDNNVIGGSYLATGSLEVDYLVYNDIGGALFVDTGDAAEDQDFSFNHSAGIGLRWRSPVGMFRLDAAKPIGKSDGVRLHISIGADL